MPGYDPLYKNSHALVIGIDHYPEQPLDNAVADARSVADLLSGLGFTVQSLFNADATNDRITTSLLNYRHTGRDDRLLVYFAGHGTTYPSADDDSEVGYLVPHYPAGQSPPLIEMNRFVEQSRIIPAKHILFVLDACFSGLALVRRQKKSAERRIEDLLTRRSVQVIAAGKKDQEVNDRWPGTGHSVFTGLLLDRLERGVGPLTGNELAEYLSEEVGNFVGSRQTPHYGHLLGTQGDWIFWPEKALDPLIDIRAMIESDRVGHRVAAIYDLEDALASEDPEREQAARAELARLADDPDPRVAEAAQRALGIFAEPPPPAPATKPAPPEVLTFLPPAEPAQVRIETPRSDDQLTFLPDVLTILPPPFAWCAIPAGRVTLEGNKGTFDVAPFHMAKYPITFEQFQIFLDAPDGFASDQWWRGLSADADHRKSPGKQRFTHAANLPRETVSWWDAVAFCRWLSAQTGAEIRLPAEWEWQWAAQGPDGREYPWGPEFDSSRCNSTESGPGKTTPVDAYPSGASPYGVLDMSGNVYEWCLNEYDSPGNTGLDGNNMRVLRGGSWGNIRHFARCAARDGDAPRLRGINFGFRVVAAPPISPRR